MVPPPPLPLRPGHRSPGEKGFGPPPPSPSLLPGKNCAGQRSNIQQRPGLHKKLMSLLMTRIFSILGGRWGGGGGRGGSLPPPHIIYSPIHNPSASTFLLSANTLPEIGRIKRSRCHEFFFKLYICFSRPASGYDSVNHGGGYSRNPCFGSNFTHC